MSDDEHKNADLEIAEDKWEQKLRSKPLVSRPVWLMRRLAYVVAWVALFLLVLAYADGIWLVIGLVIVAFGTMILGEVLTDLKYSQYREEWEIANGIKSKSVD